MSSRKRQATTTPQIEEDEEVTVQSFIEIGGDLMNKSPPSLINQKGIKSFSERWTSYFNAEPEVCMEVWSRLQSTSFDGIDDTNERPQHLLWALLFLMVYATESVLSGICECDEDTFRLYAFRFVEKISYLEFDVVSRFIF